MSLPPKGLIGVLVTPFDEEGRIDRRSLRDLVEFTIQHLDGIATGVTYTGEGFLLDREKKLELIRMGMRMIQGRLPLFLGITGDTREETEENILEVERSRRELGYKEDIFLLDCPLWYHSNRGLPRNYERLGKITSLSFVLYNNPYLITEQRRHLKRRNIRTNILKRLATNEQIVGLKNVSNLRRFINYQRAVRGRRDFRLYDGSELLFLNYPSMSGVVSGGANIFPREWKEVVDSSLDSQDPRKEEEGYSHRLWEMGQRLRRLQATYAPNPPAIIKTALKLMGKIGSDRVAGRGITEEEVRGITNLLKEYGMID